MTTADIWIGSATSTNTTSAFLFLLIFLRIFLKEVFLPIRSMFFDENSSVDFFTLFTQTRLDSI